MNPIIKDKWIAALKSGEYTQGPSRLKIRYDNDEIRHCCLGVLCELARVESITNEYPLLSSYAFGASKHTATNTMPASDVLTWAELAAYQADVLAGLNDSGWSFDRIAEYIQEYI